jgi:DNA-binding FrmR family transcriptional regulator
MLAENREEALRRLKSIEGHVRGVTRMVEEDQYCIDVIRQIRAIEGALEKLNLLVLESHLQQCVATAVRSDDAAERERVIGELLGLFESSHEL